MQNSDIFSHKSRFTFQSAVYILQFTFLKQSKKKKVICYFLSYNYDFSSHNCKFISHISDLLSQNIYLSLYLAILIFVICLYI